jgi:TolB-like protein/Tfp pilus assembly protein PilF
LFSDIVGYTALMAESEARGLRARERHRDLLRPLAARYHGKVVDESGDELLLVFPSDLDAVNCALAAQAALRDDSELRPLAEPGGLAVSEPVFDAIKNQPDVEAQPLGEQQLKHVAHPLAVYAVTGSPGEPSRLAVLGRAPALRWTVLALTLAVLGSLILLARPPAPAAPPLTALAVLPFDDMSPDGDQAWLAGGMAEDLIESLSRIEQLRVIARTSSKVMKASGADIPTIGERLQVGAIVEGSVRRSGDEIRVTAQLIRVADESHLWSARYERTLDDIFAIQQEIAREIAEAVRRELGIEEWWWLSEFRYLPKDVRAYEHMRRGFELTYSTYSEEALREAEKHYLEALEMESGYVIAHVGLMWNHWNLWSLGYDPSEERLASARAAAHRALELDEATPGAHEFLALQSILVWDYASAERRLVRALEMRPDGFGLMSLHSQLLADTGRIDGALTQARGAVDLDPLFSLLHRNMGNIYLYAGDYAAAIEELEYSLELNPHLPYTAALLAFAFHQRRMDKEALDAVLRVPLVAANPELQAATRRGFEDGGWEGMNRALTARLAAQTGSPCSRDVTVGAYLYAQSGDADRMFHCLDEALAQGRLLLGVRHPSLDPYRDDPRFEALLARVGLAD